MTCTLALPASGTEREANPTLKYIQMRGKEKQTKKKKACLSEELTERRAADAVEARALL